MAIATISLQISSFTYILRPQFCYSASATPPTTAAAATTAATTIATATATTAATATITREGPGSSAPDSLSSLANFLVDSLEFSKKQALSTSTKLTKLRQSRGITQVSVPKLRRKADLVLSFLEAKGMERPQIKKLVSSFPGILRCRIEGNLEAKMNYFLELGISVSDFADIISSHPEILDSGLNSTVRPAIEALREIMGSNENVARVIEKFRVKSLWAVSKRLTVNVSLLRAQGIPLESIQKRMINNPEFLVWKHDVFKSIMARAEVKWGVSPRSKMFIYAVYMLCCLNSKTIESKCRVFESFGWDRSHVVSLFRRHPCCFGLAERNIKAKLRFYMNELGYAPDRILAYPAALGYSLERRVMPRYLVLQLLKDKGLSRKNLVFPSVLTLSEGKFLRKFILPFLDDVPDLHDIYVNSIQAATIDETTPEKNEIGA